MSSYKDKEKVREYTHEHYLKNKEKYKEYYRNWREKNAERDKERSRKWRAEHPEYYNDPEYTKRRRQCFHDKYHNDPAFRGRQRLYAYKRLDRENNLMPADPSDYPTLEEVNEMLLQPCVFCGESDWHKIGLDRKDNRFGHIRGNIQPCCKRCNDKKRELSNEEFRQALAEGRIKLKTMKAEICDRAIPAMPTMRSLLI